MAIARSSIIKIKGAGPLIDFDLRRRGLEELADLVATQTMNSVEIDGLLEIFERPNDVVATLCEGYGAKNEQLALFGTIERRYAFVRVATGNYGITFGDYGAEQLPVEIAKRIGQVEVKAARVFRFMEHDDVFTYLVKPRVYLAALYHPDVFPLPRFSLAISDLVRAVRAIGVSQVFAKDMQLGVTVSELATDILARRPDILGISATFGQHDVLAALLDIIQRQSWFTDCQLVFGGSLSVLNRQVLLEKFPTAVVATGPGEKSLTDLVRVHRGELPLDKAAGIAFKTDDGKIRSTANISPRDTDEMLPELDLLHPTLTLMGVAQLESSRGCSYACSFCPRSHKGIWAGDDSRAMSAVLPDIKRILHRHPLIVPKVFLVDEEFFGYRDQNESEQRVLEVAEILSAHGLHFETSSRSDQVFRRTRDREWHLSRLAIWRRLVENGLDRCLFGIESGVDSILTRFNKKTTSEQNSIAIRILSLLGVPPRYTYITFDPLMTREELIATYQYQARTDLVLPTGQHHLDSEIFDIATSDQRAREHSNGTPFYGSISYMLVSMECLMGAPYTEEVRKHNLLHAFNPNMGRYDAAYLDADIGLFSDCAQRWVDRNFKVDYLLKSIEKYAAGAVRQWVRAMRGVVKDFAFDLLGMMVGLWDPDQPWLVLPEAKINDIGLRAASQIFNSSKIEGKRTVLTAIMDRLFADMSRSMQRRFQEVSENLPAFERDRIWAELELWSAQQGWGQINELK